MPKIIIFYSGSCDYINTTKTTFDLNFNLYQAGKQPGYTYKHRTQEKLSNKIAYF